MKHYLHRPDQDEVEFMLIDAKGCVIFTGEEYQCKDFHHNFTGVSLVHGLPPKPNQLPQDLFELIASHTQFTNESIVKLVTGESLRITLDGTQGESCSYWKQVVNGIYKAFNRHFAV